MSVPTDAEKVFYASNAEDKIVVCKILKLVRPNSIIFENSKARGQTV